MPDPILELNTQDRPVISIDKRDYPVMLREDFGLLDLIKLGRLYSTVADVQTKEEPALEDVERLKRALDAFVRLVLPDVEPDVYARLRDGQKLRIVEAFTGLAGGIGATRPGTASPSTGANGSPD